LNINIGVIFVKKTFENIEKALSLPYGTIDKGARIVLHNNREAIVEGCKGISEYDETCISLKFSNKNIKFVGTELTIASYEKNNVIIKGVFSSVEFE